MTALELKKISYAVSKKNILKDISLYVKQGEFVGIIGPNGSGKSTLLQQIYRQLQPDTGEIVLFDNNIRTMSLTESARKMAVVSQFNQVNFPFTVREMVMMGRIPHQNGFKLVTNDDREIVEQVLSKLGLLQMADSIFSLLSGGEKQRVIVARALAQCPEFIILDEPTNHLDIKHQLQLLNIVADLGIGILGVLHDLNLACMYCDRIYVLKDGEIYAQGRPQDIINAKLLRAVYEVEAHILIDDEKKCPVIIYERESF